MTMDYVRTKAGAALGARLRRLSERIDNDAARAYAAQGVEFEQLWFGVLNQLALNGPMIVGALAEALGITHVSVSQTRVSLERAGLIRQEPDASDARRRLLSLMPLLDWRRHWSGSPSSSESPPLTRPGAGDEVVETRAPGRLADARLRSTVRASGAIGHTGCRARRLAGEMARRVQGGGSGKEGAARRVRLLA
ncbi:MarR family transcriptional regulator [Pyxidicoccus fallax]|uniref:MarR family transcriptional regulator n=1 Tax=Pyxidicoccus fallax TaxID=394095 RepID=A0A848LV25_9BACT|nr:helix-turn-helix domain-containing protein [Pyxidicoccus fallax]NMO21460.1 MarR family transcriptional regulator [Pyxidicoccus fallax]NPC82669.1 MarR family transcriptional regulator [Pyxidicoccus fallax]